MVPGAQQLAGSFGLRLRCSPSTGFQPPAPRTSLTAAAPPAPPQIIIGELTPDSGEIIKARENMQIAYLTQVGAAAARRWLSLGGGGGGGGGGSSGVGAGPGRSLPALSLPGSVR